MVEVTLYTGQQWFIPQKVKTTLDILLADVKHSEMDLFIVFDGYEGTGKSFAARAIAMYCATKLGVEFGIDNIHFDTNDYIKSSIHGNQFQINVLDESRKALGKGKARDFKVERFLDYISECRYLQQIHIICLPAFHDLSKYVILWRMAFLIHFKKEYVASQKSFSGYQLRRGEFKMFTDQESINYCYENPYKYPTKWEAWDRWSATEVFSAEQLQAYRDKKLKFMTQKYIKEDKEKLTLRQKALFRREVIPRLKLKGFTNVEIAELFNVNKSSITRDVEALS